MVDIYAIHVAICRPLMMRLLELRAEKLEAEMDELEARPMGPRESLQARNKQKLEQMCKRVEKARGKLVGAM